MLKQTKSDIIKMLEDIAEELADNGSFNQAVKLKVVIQYIADDLEDGKCPTTK